MYAIAIHGGAGTIKRESLSPELEKRYRQGLEDAIYAGYTILAEKGTALDAVEMAVRILEDNELFNAGRGSVFTADGTHEMEASIMEGQHLHAGAVCGLKNLKNPIGLARKIMDKSNHLFLNGPGAEKFAQEMGLDFEKDSYFFTQHRFDQLKKKLQKDLAQTLGTVGAVALDHNGNLAAATSTGGLNNKNYGRIGDSPIIGAGTYANNKACAVSCTGDGEFFIRSVAAYDVFCLMDYKNLSIQDACKKVIHKKLSKMGGEGGIIAVDKHGNIAMDFNSEGMYRAAMKKGTEIKIEIW